MSRTLAAAPKLASTQPDLIQRPSPAASQRHRDCTWTVYGTHRNPRGVLVVKVVKGIGGFGLAVVLVAELATPAFAAVTASLSSTIAQPGDVITLTTLQWVSAGPVYLVSTGDFQAEIARFGGQVCGSRGQHYLGRLTPKGDTGSLSFQVPDVAEGDYYFELTVQAGCWHVAASGMDGPLVLHVGAHGVAETAGARVTPNAAQGSRPPVGSTLYVIAAIAAAILVGTLVTAIKLLGRRGRS